MRNNKKNGFSIMETVVALAVIVVVTIAALSVVMASVSARVKATNYSEARDFAHNVIECYKAADDADDFENNVSFAGVTFDENSTAPNYTYTNNRFTAKVEITGGFDVGGKLDVEITVNGNNNDEKLSFTYTRGTK